MVSHLYTQVTMKPICSKVVFDGSGVDVQGQSAVNARRKDSPVGIIKGITESHLCEYWLKISRPDSMS